MKTTALLTLTLAGTLLALPTQAQQAPPAIRILPAPAQVDPPPDFDEPEMPDDGFIMPGFPGEMMMPPMPGRYTLLSANIQKDGKLTPIVLRIDSQTGQVWQLKTSTRMIRRNGKLQPEINLSFVMVSEPAGGVGGDLPGLPVPGGFPGVRPDPDDEPAVIEAVPVEPNRRGRPVAPPRRNR
jgi:hypothetical protein